MAYYSEEKDDFVEEDITYIAYTKAPCKFTNSDYFDICFDHHLCICFPTLLNG